VRALGEDLGVGAYPRSELLLSDCDVLYLVGNMHDHLTLQDFLDLVPDEEHAEALFLSARWPRRGAVSVGALAAWPGLSLVRLCR